MTFRFVLRVGFLLCGLVAGRSFAATVAGAFPAATVSVGTMVSLSNREQVFTATVGGNGAFTFAALEPGQYVLQISSTCDYTLKQAVSARVLAPSDAVQLGNVAVQRYIVEGSSYSYVWSQDQTYAGTEATANIVAPTVITLLGKAYKMADLSYAEELKKRYNIILVDSLHAWDSERAYRLFSTLDRIPYADTSPYRFNAAATSTVWRLTPDYLDQDLTMETIDGVRTITVSTAAFVYAAPFVAQIEDKRGLYFSKRLHHALLRFVSNNGEDTGLIEGILQQRFGVSTRISDYLALTGELAGRFQPFRPGELLQIINSFEELPEGFHVIPALKYLIRRLDGTINSQYPEALALATGAYIEFMEKAFARNSEISVQRLILHEKGHFIYWSVISPAIREAWHKLGGWYADANGDWTTEKTTEFVSAYAHGKNPNEDFAETVAAFVTNPDILKSRSMAKYEFFRDAVMFGNSYVSQIRQDLTFQVLNLFPNYNYPGKIKRVQVSVSGAPEEDKVVTLEMEIQPVGPSDHAVSGLYMRVFGPKTKELPVAPYVDWYLSPIAPGSSVLRGAYTMSKYSRSGYWAPDQITVTDVMGNQRYERAVLYGWRCYVDNPLQDLSPPQYVANSARMNVKPAVLDGRPVQILSVDWDVVDDRGLIAYTSSLRPPGANQYSINTWGQPFLGNGTAHVEYVITEFYPSGIYRTSQVVMKDYGLNFVYAYFTDGGGGGDGIAVRIDEPPPSIAITTPNPDYDPPELDLNRISVVATPTVPEAPNGETQVTIKYLARDNKSGMGPVWFRLRDPQGIEHFHYHYHANFYGTFFNGDPTAWQQYTATVLLPVGSVPGTWGLASINLGDKALNSKSYSFVEIVRFDPFSTAAADLGITGDPVGGSFARGSSVALTVIVVGGNKVSYKWLKNGVVLTSSATTSDSGGPPRAASARIVGADTATLSISGLTDEDAGSYSVVVSNTAGAVASKAAQVTVSSDASPVITTQPVSQAVALGANVTFTVVATGSPTPTYQWRKNGTAINGATNASYTIANVGSADLASYNVVVANSVDGVPSSAAILTLSATGTAPVITTQPVSQAGALGASVTFTVVATGSPAPTYQWRKNGTAISGATNASYTIASVGSADLASYNVVVANSVDGVPSSAAILTLSATGTAPVITTQPVSQAVALGANVTFSVVATGTPAPTYQWRKNGTAINGATNASYTLASVVSTDLASYTVAATNSVDTVVSNAAILSLSATGTAPVITTQPLGRLAAVETGVIFSVVATGSAGLTYQWKKDGGVLAESTRITGSTTASLSVANLAAADAGSYSVVVTNGSLSTTSSVAALTVVDVRATHAVVGPGYVPGGTVTVNSTVTYAGPCVGLAWTLLLPEGWTYASGGGTEGETKPPVGTPSLLEWAWTNIPASPVTFSTTLNVPSGAAGAKTLAASAIFRIAAGPLTMMVKPDPLSVSAALYHSADTGRDLRIGLVELTRVIELYNTRIGTARTGCYKIESGSEDGFTPESTRTASAVVTLANWHSADSNRDGKIGLLELTRVIELYNYRSGSIRTGAYHLEVGTEDGFALGP